MQDIFQPEVRLWQHIEALIRSEMETFAYREIRTPVLEKTELFVRGVGGGTDIVKKEMYTFSDKGDRSVTMRPEGTASVVRAVNEHGLLNAGEPVSKYYYIGPMFRYERPQKGRLRQFHQFGVECFGSDSPFVDAEVIQILYNILTKLKLSDISVKLNSIGCPECRPVFRQNAEKYFGAVKDKLCVECNERINTNPLRIYDCKTPSCKENITGAPVILDHLCEGCSQHFESVKRALAQIGVPFVIDARLVRGLDYYTRTAFEVTSKHLGAQDALGGGGRYDDLVSELGGQKTPAIGFGMGIERVVIAVKTQNIDLGLGSGLRAYVVPLSRNEAEYAFKLLDILRKADISAQMAVSEKKTGVHFKDAEKAGADFAVIIGEDEIKNGTLTVKDLRKRSQQSVSEAELAAYIKNN
ncbi:MAG: histidine--tRNA ligase [Candidatus Wallbacteria bacterium GWC2_49_35]|uniref:Histidine--tRNA ligase n=1 Tax=Candidatus Wallbacteria bacterium GWC2_49_35 TaxID=1817813 RepID=A0A1F7WLR2_9BACT|nr:MAG: histidine--tRNA ligase [Candidatus Wallbacteria bacterium GWC2_49_35]